MTWRYQYRGFTLVELMVAITIGLIILAAVSSVFVSAKRSYNEQDRQAKMQENARFALHFLMYDLRNAGYYGCLDDVNADTVKNTLKPGGGLFLNALFPIEGLDNATAGSQWYPSADSTSVPAGIRENTDAIVLRMALANNAVNIARPMPNSSSILHVDALGGITEGDIIMLSDCASADIMQVTEANGTALTIQHNPGGSILPGNNTQFLQKPYSPPARVMKFTSRMYYIGERMTSGGVKVPGLWRKDNTDPAEELVEGVEHMHITYGKDTDTPPDDIPNVYLRAGQAGLQTPAEWERVRAIRIGLLVRTPSDKDQDKDIVTNWDVNGHPVAASGDNYRRRLFHVTVQLRNML